MTSRPVAFPYSRDSAEIVARLLSLPCPVFLDSCAHGPRAGRYDIISAQPLATLTVESGQLCCSETLPASASEDLFLAADYLLRKFAPPPRQQSDTPPQELPFQGGLLGYLGYPLLQGHGAWRVQQAYLGIYPWVLVVDHLQQRSLLYFQPCCPAATRERVTEALHQPRPPTPHFELLAPFANDTTESQYRQAFNRIKEYIDAGDCYQVNLTQRFSSRFSGDPFAAYCRLREASGKPFSAYLRWDDKALLSLSPERFIQVHDRQVVTQPIKGTRPRGNDTEQDRRLAEALLASEKDRAENLMIVDLLRNDLGTLCEYGSIKVTKLFELQQFDNVHHLVSTVTGRLPQDITTLQLLQKCFPGGSITGAPKLRAMEIIEALETQRRDAYCGSVLYLDFNGRMDSSITIRTLLTHQQEIFCWAGGGIVADSVCAQEYAECFDKIGSLIRALQE